MSADASTAATRQAARDALAREERAAWLAGLSERDRATIDREEMKAQLAGKIGANGYREASVDGSRSMIAVDSRSRSRCNCCKKRSTHIGLGDGLALMDGCELTVRRWVRDGYTQSSPSSSSTS